MNPMIEFTTEKPLRIGTRQSPLAMIQAHMVADLASSKLGITPDCIRLVPMLAGGDKVQDRPLAEIGGKALWTKELERALIDDAVDIAVHSMKDVETVRPDIFGICAMLPRADVRDRLIGAPSINALPHGARIGTSSPRRGAQILALRPDLQIMPLRGNVATRLRAMDEGRADATLLAAAGLDRLGMADKGAAIPVEEMLPAASQGAIGIDILSNRTDLRQLIAALGDERCATEVWTERAFLEALGGTCHSPVGALAQTENGKMVLTGQILLEDGSESHKASIICEDGNSPARLAQQLLDIASPALRSLFGK